MIQRVNGSLAVSRSVLTKNEIPASAFPLSFASRALGDFEYKNVDGKGPTEQLVSPEPEFYIKVKKNLSSTLRSF